ncbi:hypothetical protein SAMN05444678_1302 [Sphingomonas sp. YR710]|nr:hypothetical protein SAMN05444678_1302 [Sphingomonas sp. YR710]
MTVIGDREHVTDPLTRAETYLGDKGMLNCPGAVLYSSYDTLAPCPMYILGLNPGGDDSVKSTIADNIFASRRGNNSYLDEEWSRNGRLQKRGQAVLQRRMQNVASLVGINLRHIPATNLAFTRSRNIAGHLDFHGAVELCKPVHEIFLSAVQPKLLFTFGNVRHFANSFVLDQCEERSAYHANWKAYRGRVVFGSRSFAFGNVPHLSLWGGENKNDVLRWALEAAISPS